jgi:hypothetical protein
VAGAEYGNGTTNAEIYNPQNNSWSIVPIPAGIIAGNNTINTNNQSNTAGFSDAGSVVLNDGRVLIAPVYPYFSGYTTIYDPVANTWTTQALIRGSDEDEAGFVKLPDDSILTIDYGTQSSERFVPSTNTWVDDGSVPVALYDPYGLELGPCLLLPNGTAFFIGSTPYSAFYTPGGDINNRWTRGPDLPANLGAPDAPAAMMPNGKILCLLSPTPTSTNNIFTTPIYFYEYDYQIGANGTFYPISAPGGQASLSGVTFNCRLLDLPDGTVLFTSGGTQLYVYVPDGTPIPSGKPAIQTVSWTSSSSLHLTGTLFNGISQGTSYGDDVQNDSNYPIVRFKDGSGNVNYGRTHDWSSTSVMTGNTVVSTECDLPINIFAGMGVYSLQVVANGIASDPVTFDGPVWVDFTFNFPTQLGTYALPFSTLTQGTNAVPAGGAIILKGGHSPSAVTISKPMTITADRNWAWIGQ